MDKLLIVIASRLEIRNVVDKNFDNETETNKAKRKFQREFKKHLFTKLRKIQVGECVEYCFNCGNIRPLGTVMENANDNMAEILLRLPSLKEKESYELPENTYISFKLIERYEQGGTVELSEVCPWIMKAYTKE